MSSTCFEPEGSSSGRRLYVQVWYSVFTRERYKQSSTENISVTKVHLVGFLLYDNIRMYDAKKKDLKMFKYCCQNDFM